MNSAVGQKVIARKVLDFPQARVRYVEALRINWVNNDVTEKDVNVLSDFMKPYIGDGCDVVITFSTERAQGDIRLGSNWKIMPDDQLIHELQKHYGKQNVQLVYN